jgi:hypothetical protein
LEEWRAHKRQQERSAQEIFGRRLEADKRIPDPTSGFRIPVRVSLALRSGPATANHIRTAETNQRQRSRLRYGVTYDDVVDGEVVEGAGERITPDEFHAQ